jgi:hypothetical protein
MREKRMHLSNAARRPRRCIQAGQREEFLPMSAPDRPVATIGGCSLCHRSVATNWGRAAASAIECPYLAHPSMQRHRQAIAGRLGAPDEDAAHKMLS